MGSSGMPWLGDGTTAPILSGEDIICLAHEPWHGPWKTYQQIMSLLAESNRVFYVGPPVTLRDAVKSFRARAKPFPVLEHVGQGLFIYHEPRLLARVRDDRPLGGAYNWSTARARTVHTRYLAGRLGFRSPILWVFDPMQAYAAGLFHEKLLVYHVLDNYVEFLEPSRTAARAAIVRNEEYIIKRADLVFAVSRPLYERCLTHNVSSYLVPNGVDYDRFQTTIASGTLPSDLQGIRRPIVGYVGAIQGDMNFPLLHRLAAEVPLASLVLVGPEELGGDRSQFETLQTRANVHYLGAKAVEDVPLYINACDVCILPCNDDKSAIDSDQIKLYEYLACGRPVVSINLPGVQRFSPLVKIARDVNEFIAHVKTSLQDDEQWVERRKREASHHSWRHRVATLSGALLPKLSSSAQHRENQS